MSMPITEQILVRMLAVLLNSTSAGINVYRSLEVAITSDITPAIIIIPSEESDSVFSASADLHDFMVNVEISARGDPWDISANKVAGELHKVLMFDPTLTALVNRIRKISSKWEGEEADKTAGVLSMKYRITYLTAANDISSNSIL